MLEYNYIRRQDERFRYLYLQNHIELDITNRKKLLQLCFWSTQIPCVAIDIIVFKNAEQFVVKFQAKQSTIFSQFTLDLHFWKIECILKPCEKHQCFYVKLNLVRGLDNYFQVLGFSFCLFFYLYEWPVERDNLACYGTAPHIYGHYPLNVSNSTIIIQTL